MILYLVLTFVYWGLRGKTYRHRRVLSSFNPSVYLSNCLCLSPSACVSVRPSQTMLPLWVLKGFQISAWNLVGRCTMSRSRSLFKMAMLGQLCALEEILQFSMIGLDEVSEGWRYHSDFLRISGISLQFSGGDAHYHEADCCSKWLGHL